MDLNEYQQLALRTAKFEHLSKTEALHYLFFGLGSEVGEALGVVKRTLRGDFALEDPVIREKLKAELGDCLWYLSVAAQHLGYELNEIGAANVAKLADRMQRDVIKGEGDTR